MTTTLALLALSIFHAPPLTANEKSGVAAFSEFRNDTVTIQPSGIAFDLPGSWLEWHSKFKNNIHLSREQLTHIKDADEKCEWDHEYSEIVNAILPFDQCVFHGGGEGWGREGVSFGDVQMRAYVSSWDFEHLGKVIASVSLRKAARSQSERGPWHVATLRKELWYGDYGGTAIVDIYSRKKDKTAVVLVFMYSDYRGKQEEEIRKVLDSFRLDGKTLDSPAPNGQKMVGTDRKIDR